MDIVNQLENFKNFIDNFNPTVVSNIELRRKYYQSHPEEAKKNNLYSKSTGLFKNIVVTALQLNNSNAGQLLNNIEKQISQCKIEENMFDELIVRISKSIISSNLTITNTKENHAKLISIIEKYNAGFLNKFVEYQQTFSIEMLDCLMYIYMDFNDIEDNLIEYLKKGNKDSLTELLKFINISSSRFKNIYRGYINNITNLTGYMKFIVDEIEEKIN
jgi:hypothetical protein